MAGARGTMQTLVSEQPSSGRVRSVRTAVSNSADPVVAVAELAEQLHPDSAACVVFFCTPTYDLHALGKAVSTTFEGTLVMGCTTAGEIADGGVIANPISAVAFNDQDFTAAILHLDDLAFADESHIASLVRETIDDLSQRTPWGSSGHSFALSLLDGLSSREEMMLPVVHHALDGIPLFGGSAGDAMNFNSTYVYCNGGFQENAAAIALISTRCPFSLISSHHFAPSNEKLIVTKADPERRVVLEFNAEPAAPEYCRVMGLSLDDLSDGTFACHPLGVQLGEHLFVRSVRQVNDDLSLTFFCAIDNGIILTKLNDTGLLEHFGKQMQSVTAAIGETQLVLGCDCIHRFQEAEQKQQLDALTELYRRFNVVGFKTFGEQRDGLHVNHSFTGIAIGYRND